MTLKLKPLHDVVLIELVDNFETTASGLILTPKAQLQYAKVLKVGTGYLDGSKLAVAEGDTVILRPNQGRLEEYEIDGHKVVFINEHQIMAVVTE